MPCRAVLDSASQSIFAQNSLPRNLIFQQGNVLLHYNASTMSAYGETETNLEIHSCVNDFQLKTNCIVLRTIKENRPSTNIQAKEWNLPTDIQYADPNFNVSQPIDNLLGSQIFFQVLVMKKRTSRFSNPTIQATQFGWIIAGTYMQPTVQSSPTKTLFIRSDVRQEQQLQRFPDAENTDSPTRSTQQMEDENHFNQHSPTSDYSADTPPRCSSVQQFDQRALWWHRSKWLSLPESS